MNKKIIISLVAIVVIVVGIVYYNNQADSNKPDILKVGVITPLTGQYAALGESIRDAIKLAVENNPKIQLIFEDDSFDAKKGLSAYNKLTSIDKVDIIVNVGSPTLNVIQPLVDESKMLTFTLTETDYKADDSVFQLMPFSYPIFTAIGKEAAKRYDRIAVVYGALDILDTDKEYFKKEVPAEKIVHEVMISGDSDLKTEVSKILASNPDAMTVIVDKDTGIKLLKVLKEQMGSKKVDIICDANLEFVVSDYVNVIGKDLLENCISANLPNSTTQEFKDNFNKKYGYNPLFISDYAYDAMTIIKNLENVNKNDWIKKVKKTNLEGVSGDIKLDENGTRFPEYELHIFKDGAFVKLEN